MDTEEEVMSVWPFFLGGGGLVALFCPGPLESVETPLIKGGPCYLKAIKGPVVFKSQDVVGDGEDVAVGGNQTAEVDGFGWCTCEKKRHTDKKEA